MSFYTVARVLFSRIFRFIFHVTPVGIENIPKEGGLIVCSNHKSMADPFLLGIVLNRSLYFMAKAELFKIPVFNLLILSLGAFPVHRGVGDRRAAAKSLDIVRRGRALAMFPEGHRLKEGEVPGTFKTGAVKFAFQAGVPILPVAVVCAGKSKLFFQHKIIAVGKPINSGELGVADGNVESFRQASELVRQKVIGLIESNRSGL